MSTNSFDSFSMRTLAHFEGQTVLVTGGIGSIGSAIAACFCDAGAKVHATGPTEAECERAKIADRYQGIKYGVLDVRSNQEVKQYISELDDLHVVVNCAGIIRRGEERNLEVFESVVDVNLNGTMRVCEASIEKLVFAT